MLYPLVVPPSLPLLMPPQSLKHNNVEIRPSNNPTIASRCLSERKSHTFLIFSQKLKMIKFSEEGLLKAETVQKLGLLSQLAKL